MIGKAGSYDAISDTKMHRYWLPWLASTDSRSARPGAVHRCLSLYLHPDAVDGPDSHVDACVDDHRHHGDHDGASGSHGAPYPYAGAGGGRGRDRPDGAP